MDPVVDTGFDEGVNNDLVNPVQPRTLESDLFPPTNPLDSAAQAPELYPHGATGQLEGAAPIPGSTERDQLPVPPPQFMLHQQQQEHERTANDEDDDEVEGDDLFGDGDDDDDDEDGYARRIDAFSPVADALSFSLCRDPAWSRTASNLDCRHPRPYNTKMTA